MYIMNNGLFKLFSESLKFVTRLHPVASQHPIYKSLAKLILLSSLLLPVQNASATQNLEAVLGKQVAQGREIFINETFSGNGRTCATCHRLDNNHTLDPQYIAKLPSKDPLFVAEFNPLLKELEDSELLRKLGLIATNLDGFDQPVVYRSVPHLLGISTSIASEAVDFPEDAKFAHALGWSGDGAPDDGSLKMFAQGAIRQHLTKSMKRVVGVDFRLATELELDALVAYMLSLGRQEELDLAKITFKSPIAEKGKLLFDVKENALDTSGKPIFGTANCKGCHENAGANSSTTKKNPSRNTGVENTRNQAHRLLDPTAAADGGFGLDDKFNCVPDANLNCLGDGRFNTPSLIEAADTPPYFHNNSVSTLEEAIAFYNTDAFNTSPGALTSSGKDRRVKIDSSEVIAIATFLRAINVVENTRSAIHFLNQSNQLNIKDGRKILKLAMADTQDAIEVLQQAVLNVYPNAVNILENAYNLEHQASEVGKRQQRNQLIAKAVEKLTLTQKDILTISQ